ncbi:phenylalanine--tRNA ligase subunit beta [Acidobacteriota bacterium]
MKISLNWLKDYIDLSLSVPELIDCLNGIGLMVDSWERIGRDVLLDIETYANRPDTLGHYGIARELSAKLQLPLIEQNWPLFEIAVETSEVVDIQIWDEELCPRYCGMVVKDVQIGPTPDWLKKKIQLMGLNPVNNVVDVSNYVLFSTAQPIHTFDLDKVVGGKINIRKALKDEELKSLDGNTLKLTADMLVIADEEKPVALAGVIGGVDSSVTRDTCNIFIESACFNPVSVRQTAKLAGLQTDASYRFERGADISFSPQAAIMAASLLTQFGGKVTKGIIDAYPHPKKDKTVVLRHHRITELLGMEVESSFITRILKDLGFQVGQQQEHNWQVQVPQFRIDIEREADLIEEIARFYGYDRIPSRFPPLKELEPTVGSERRRIEELCQLMYHSGYDEVINFSFTSPEKEDILCTQQTPVKIRNPISTKTSLLRTSLIGGLLENLSWNKNRGADGVHLFEIGKLYFIKDEKYHEELALGFITSGLLGNDSWQVERELTSFFSLKGTCEALMEQLGYLSYTFEEDGPACFEDGLSINLQLKGQTIGNLGQLKKEVLKSFEIKGSVWAAELNLSQLFEKQHTTFQYSPVGKYPSVSRDVSFLADQDVSYQEIKSAIQKLKIPFLESFYLQDRFEGKPIPLEKVSLSFRFIFRHPIKTLLTEEVDSFHQQIVDVLKSNFNFQLREGG